MIIRKALPTDAEAIAQQNVLLAAESEKISLTYETVLAGVKGLLSDETKGFYLVAEEQSTIIGQLMVTFEWSDWKNTMMWWLQSVYVKKPCRKKAVFTTLFQYILQEARSQHVSYLRLYAHTQNRNAQIVYQTVGMKKQPYVLFQIET